MQRGTLETFRGIYSPVYAADAAYYFLTTNPQGFGTMDPTDNNDTRLLMDNLPMVQQGYMLRVCMTMLFSIYAHYHLQDPTDPQIVIPDDLMNRAFGGTIPAALYSYRGAYGKINDMTMREAIERRLITAPLNTYDVINQEDPEFDRTRFNTHHLQTLVFLNFFNELKLGAEPTLAPVLEAITRPDVREAMLREHNIIQQIFQQVILEPEQRVQREARRAQRHQVQREIRRAWRRAERQNAPRPIPELIPTVQLTINPMPTLPTVQLPTVNPMPTLPTVQLPTVNPITFPGVPTIFPNTQTTVPVPKVTIPPWITQGKK
ncbi:Hypothetical protein HVR_LOCUS1337 [uncultured virus]|nr:Hypothetical protein HVR_LOCUS1337 [uncultured virus]